MFHCPCLRRPPEVLVSDEYGPKVDVWAIGEQGGRGPLLCLDKLPGTTGAAKQEQQQRSVCVCVCVCVCARARVCVRGGGGGGAGATIIPIPLPSCSQQACLCAVQALHLHPPPPLLPTGCLFAEMASGRPLFPGKTSADQLWLTLRTLGPMTQRQTALMSLDPGYTGLSVPPANERTPLEQRFPGFSDDMMHLLRGCLELDPAKRLTADEALAMPYFDEVPKIQVSGGWVCAEGGVGSAWE